VVRGLRAAEATGPGPMSLCGISCDIEGEHGYVMQAIRARLDEVQAANPGLPLKVRLRVDAKYPKAPKTKSGG
jgi:hypothetical protein